MGGFLEGYGAGEERRSKILWRIVLGALAVVILATGLYFVLRGHGHKKVVAAFLDSLRRQDFQGAYQMWGCSPAHPCRDYSFERFLEDWGPKSPRSNAAAVSLKQTKYCGHGLIAFLDDGKGEETLLWVESKDMTLGFAPWPVCNPMYKPVSQ